MAICVNKALDLKACIGLEPEYPLHADRNCFSVFLSVCVCVCVLSAQLAQ